MQANLRSIHLTSGADIETDEGITLVVGPNNAGKSALLSETFSALQRDPGTPLSPGLVVARVAVEWDGGATAALEDLKKRYIFREPGTDSATRNLQYPSIEFPSGQVIPIHQVESILNAQDTLGQMATLFVHHFVPEGRTEMVGAAPAFNELTEKPNQPMQYLYADRSLEKRLSDEVESAFGVPLTFNRYSGQSWGLHVGAPTANERKPPQTSEYLQQLADLPPIQTQGHGMRSFVGIALTIMAGSHRLILLDEPEAFLHPPQARSLGRLLARLTPRGVKIVVATHSNDMVQGITEGASDSVGVAIHRITRDGNRNSIASIQKSAVKGLYTDPLMRFSSILQGLFFHGVVLCEAEGDCTYYRAVLENLPPETPHVDIHFTHTNGKARLARAATSLRMAAVPVATIVDIDILNDSAEFARLVAAHGGEPSDFSTALKAVQTAVEQKGETVNKAKFKAACTEVLRSEGTTISDDGLKALRDLAKTRSGWKTFKSVGESLLTSAPRRHFKSILSDCASLGIFIVPSGELESFHPDEDTGDKGKWIRTVLEKRLYASGGPQNGFVSSVQTFIAEHQADPELGKQPLVGPDAPVVDVDGAPETSPATTD